MKQTKIEKENKKTVDDAKNICCQIGQKKDFAFMSKSHLALIVGRLYTLISEKEGEIEKLKLQVDDSHKLILQLKEESYAKE